MDDSERQLHRATSGADFLEWNFSLMSEDSPWSVEQGMTQLLAHENAEGFGPRLSDAAQDDARIIQELARRETPTALAALRGFAAMSTVDTQRDLARLQADRLVARGLPDPPWVSTIGQVRVDGCWWAHDHYGEVAVVVCGFSYDGDDEHGIMAVIDRAIGGGRFRELTLSLRIDPLRRIVEEAQGTPDGLVSEALDPAVARRLFEDAIDTTDELSERPEYKLSPLPVAYRKMRALTLARARRLSAAPAAEEPFPTTVEIELQKRSFLASPQAAALPTGDATTRAVDLLVDEFVEQAACDPLRLGPRRVVAVLGLPAFAERAGADPAVGELLPTVAAAWIDWTAVQRGLPEEATDRLRQAADQAGTQLRAAMAGGTGPN